MKSDSVSAYVHMKRDTLSPFGMTPLHSPSYVPT